MVGPGWQPQYPVYAATDKADRKAIGRPDADRWLLNFAEGVAFSNCLTRAGWDVC
jgi:hypothetical protein